jgi:hypothetical protein
VVAAQVRRGRAENHRRPRSNRRNWKAAFGVLTKEDLGGATGRHQRPPHFTGFWRLEGHPPVRLAVGPSGKAPLTAEMEIRVLGVADRPPAVMLLEGGYRLVLLLLGHDTSFLHAHGARQDCLLRVGTCRSYGNDLCALQYARRLQSRTRIGRCPSVASPRFLDESALMPM